MPKPSPRASLALPPAPLSQSDFPRPGPSPSAPPDQPPFEQVPPLPMVIEYGGANERIYSSGWQDLRSGQPRATRNAAVGPLVIELTGSTAGSAGRAAAGARTKSSLVSDTSELADIAIPGFALEPKAEPTTMSPEHGGGVGEFDAGVERPRLTATTTQDDALQNALDALPPSMLGDSSAERVRAPETIDAPAPEDEAEDPANSATAKKDGKSKTLKAPKYSGLPEYYEPLGTVAGPPVDVLARQVPYDPNAFRPSLKAPEPINTFDETQIYRGKSEVPTQRPIIELGRPLFTGGIYPEGKEWFGRYNLVMPHFMVYGDYRSGVGINRNSGGDFNNLAARLNLDMDLEITATERIHAFMGPLDRAGDFSHIDFTNDIDFVNRTDMRLDTLFFEGDAGAIWGGLSDQDSPFDLPFSFGLLPFFYQNGIWAADAAMGAAVALPAKHSKLLKWSNFDATFFWASDQVTSDAFPGDNNAAEFFGTAWFIEAYDGYIEADYAFVHDDVGEHRSYHNFSVAYSKRYFHKISNSIRFITNFNQSLPRDQRTAEGHMILLENSLISKTPNTLVPYFNVFYGQGRTQSLARAGVAGGILNNTGINFENDGLTGYPTLDATGVNTTGAALGVNMLGANFEHQLILEFAGLAANGSQPFRNAPGDQYAIGMRYQKPLSNAWIFRTDHMYGFLRNAQDIRGSRFELRWKF